MDRNADRSDADLDVVRRQAADAERAAILRIIEDHARRLAHGHGATGAQVLQQVADAIQQRGSD